MNDFMRRFADVIRLPPPHLEACDVVELLRSVTHLMREDCRQRRIDWRSEALEDLPEICLDPAQMEQVFINILKNAMEAVESGEQPSTAGFAGGSFIGSVTVRTGYQQGRPSITVKDTGAGIPPDARENLFTPFFTTKADGQGIGLPMVRHILSAHGFDFLLQESETGGSEFIILF